MAVVARYIRRVFAIDPRSLALFRVGLGILLLVDLVIRVTDCEAHYSDLGVIPRELIASQTEEYWIWSIHMLSGAIQFQYLLMGIAAVAAVCLTVGRCTRVATVVSWVLLVSLHDRNLLILNGGDVLVRTIVVLGDVPAT